jgi:hypothetical protein
MWEASLEKGKTTPFAYTFAGPAPGHQRTIGGVFDNFKFSTFELRFAGAGVSLCSPPHVPS